MVNAIDRKKEPSRIAQLAVIGAEPFDAGVPAADADAWRGLLSCSPALLDRLARQAGLHGGGRPLLTMLSELIEAYRDPLTRRGQVALFRRRRDRYLADCARWAATPPSVKLGPWRSKRMTKGQRYEVIRTCQRLEIEAPCPMTRGQAADWLNANGANLNYREKESDND
jgi:hypothetical protein